MTTGRKPHRAIEGDASPTKRFTATASELELEHIDEAADRAGLTRSAFLVRWALVGAGLHRMKGKRPVNKL